MFLPKSLFIDKEFFGLAISPASIRGLGLNQKKEITSYAQVTVPGGVLDGEITKPQILTETFKKIKLDGKFSSPNAAIVIPESYAFSRELTLPIVNPEEVREAIGWQQKNIFPFSPQEMYLDWKLLKQTEKETTVLVTAMPRKLIDGLREALEAAAIYPISVEPSISAVSRLVSFEGQPIIGLVEVDSRGSSATLVENGISLLTTTSSLAIQKNAPNLATAVTDSVSTLVRYYQEKYKVATDALPFFLTGERADKNLADSLTSSLKRPIALLTVDKITPPFHQAYAAATTHVLSPASEKSINLIPTPLQELYEAKLSHRLFQQTFRVSLALCLISIVLIGIPLITQIISLQSISQKKQSLENQLAAAEAPFPVKTTLDNATRLQKLFPLKITPQEELITALDTIPATIKVESIIYEADKRTFHLSGRAENRQDVLTVRDELEETGLFDNIQLPLNIFETAENIPFTLDFSLVNQNQNGTK